MGIRRKIMITMCIIIMIFIMCIPYTSKASEYIDDGYVITHYGINVKVNEDNSFNITETISTFFKEERHGIYRTIPLSNKIERTDGSISKNKAIVTNVRASEEFTESTMERVKKIQIGNPEKTVKGEHIYKIEYTYNIGKDPLKNIDEFYFNLIGTEWDTTIENVDFSIELPKEFDKSLLGMTSGEKGSMQTSNVEYQVIGNVITGNIKNKLNPHEALTVRLTLPEGYFNVPNIKPDKYSIILMFGFVICIVFAYLIWDKYGKDSEVIETVEFNPPEGLNPLELQFALDGQAYNKSVIALLIYLADKGYIKIEIFDKDPNYETGSFKLIKLKDYDGNNEYERLFFEGLFKKELNVSVDIDKANQILEESKKQNEKITYKEALKMTKESNELKDVVTEIELKDEFYTTVNKIKTKINKKENKDKIFDKTSTSKKWKIGLIIVSTIIITLISLKPFIEYCPNEIADVIGIMFLQICSIAVFVLGIVETRTLLTVLYLYWSLMLGGLPIIGFVDTIVFANENYKITYLFGIATITVLSIFVRLMPKRTEYGSEILGKIKGFKRFIKTAEKEQLEFLVHQNPEYFYQILPYAYALDITDEWVKQFNIIALKPPTWYISSSDFNINRLSNSLLGTMMSAQYTMTYDSTSSSSGGSSGGGSSGGGSGGGGGGSW